MKMDMKRLCALLDKAPEEETVSTEGCNRYLLEHVLFPAIRGEAPRLRDIDYEQFEEDDVSAVMEIGKKLEQAGRKLDQFIVAISSIEPIPCRARQFC